MNVLAFSLKYMSETANNIQSPIRSNKFGQRLTEFCTIQNLATCSHEF